MHGKYRKADNEPIVQKYNALKIFSLALLIRPNRIIIAYST